MQFPDLEAINYSKTEYPKIISQKHYKRLQLLTNDAILKGAKAETDLVFDDSSLSIHPVLLSQVNIKSKIMEEEIFGPVLPIISFKNIEEAADFIRNKPKPLAMYIFSDEDKEKEFLIANTSAGGTVVNNLLIQFAEINLPFGGVNNSGFGSAHGYFGFKTFSHERAVVFQSKINLTRRVFPPYHGKERILKLLKFFTG